MAEQLSAVGVDITVEPLDGPAITAARRPGPDGPPAVEMFIAVFESHAHADPDHLFFFFHTPGRGVGGIFSGYANPAFDAVLDQALAEPAETKLPLIRQAQEIFAEEAPAVVLYYPDGRWGYRPEVYDGWTSDPGHGVFTKRSFLEPYAKVAQYDEPEPEAEPEAEDEDEAPAPAEPEAPESEPEEAEDAAPAAQPDDSDDGEAAPTPSSTAGGDDGLSGGAAAIIVVVVLAVVVALGYGLGRRRGGAATVED